MRLLVLTPDSPSAPRSGNGTLAHHLARDLAHRPGAEVEVVALTDDGVGAEAQIDQSARPPFTVTGVVARQPEGRARIGRALLRLGLNEAERRFVREAAERSRDADAAIWFGSAWDPVTLALPAACECPVIHHPNDSITLFERRRASARLRPIRERLASLQECRALRAGYKATVYVSALDAAEAQRIVGTAPVHTIPLGVDVKTFRPAARAARRAEVLFSGVMAYGPNHDAAMHLLGEILPHLPATTRVRLVGRDPLPALRAASARDPRVELTGAVADISREFRRAAVYAAPIISGAGFRHKLLEAMASGLAIVATSLAVEGFGSPPPGVLVADDPKEFAAMVTSLLEDESRCRALGGAARAFVESGWSWEHRAERVLALMTGG
jgi:glycosyltransferase involved in cell wall biosynthesis